MFWNEKIKEALVKRHSTALWKGGELIYAPNELLFFELYTATGYAQGNPQRIDAYNIESVPSKGFAKTAYEIKVSKGDFIREMKNPNKRRTAMEFSNQFYFVAPVGLLKDPVPLGCGLIEVNEQGKCLITTKAPWREALPPTWAFSAAMARHIARKK